MYLVLEIIREGCAVLLVVFGCIHIQPRCRQPGILCRKLCTRVPKESLIPTGCLLDVRYRLLRCCGEFGFPISQRQLYKGVRICGILRRSLHSLG